MEPFKKYVSCIMVFLIPIGLCHTVNFARSLPLSYWLNFTKKLLNEKKRRFFAYMAASAYHVTSKKIESQIFRHNWIFRHTCVYKQTTLTKWWNIIFLFQSYIVISYTMVYFFLDVLFFLLAVILSEFYEEARRKKDWLGKSSTKKNLCEGRHMFDGTSSPRCHLLLLPSSTLLPKWRTCWMTPMKIHNILMSVILCGIENMKISWNLIIAGLHL